MVNQGPFFSAQLVYADSKVKFQEHTAANGQVYVEVEPDAEYFIRVRSHHPGVVLAYFEVDGEDLGYRTSLNESSGYLNKGLWSSDGVNSTMKALVFVKAPVRMQGDPSDAPPYWTGEIRITFYQGIANGTRRQQGAHVNSWGGGNVGYMVGNDPSKKKGLKSSKGEYEEVKQVSANRTYARFSKGELLDTIVLKYCSTIGLIHAGILPKPPAWELHRMMYPGDSAPVDPTTAGTTVNLADD